MEDLIQVLHDIKDSDMALVLFGALLVKKYLINGLSKRWVEHLSTIERLEKLKLVELGRLRKGLIKSDIILKE